MTEMLNKNYELQQPSIYYSFAKYSNTSVRTKFLNQDDISINESGKLNTELSIRVHESKNYRR